ncbi:MAG: hypothetical protein KDI98_07250, partial [Hyphomicrobiaceae bacterium]|nr:hypothetical protein [Hyphomicrobiaceae bacterium]
YGRAGRFEDLERWAERLRTIGAAFPEDAAIRLREAKGAYNATNHYGRAGRFEDMERWRARLAAVARDFPADPQIQALASNFGVTYVAQTRH